VCFDLSRPRHALVVVKCGRQGPANRWIGKDLHTRASDYTALARIERSNPSSVETRKQTRARIQPAFSQLSHVCWGVAHWEMLQQKRAQVAGATACDFAERVTANMARNSIRDCSRRSSGAHDEHNQRERFPTSQPY